MHVYVCKYVVERLLAILKFYNGALCQERLRKISNCIHHIHCERLQHQFVINCNAFASKHIHIHTHTDTHQHSQYAAQLYDSGLRSNLHCISDSESLRPQA